MIFTSSIVFNVPNDNDVIYQRLEGGVVHYGDTVKPGLDGLSIVLGHSSAYPWYKGDYGAVFALLNKLKPGDRFYVQYSDNRTFVFEMTEAIIFNPFEDDARLNALAAEKDSAILLVSCYPVGTNYKRIAIHAKLVKV